MAKRKRRGPEHGPCPCGSTDLYTDCCGPLHQGAQQALTAVEVMRARYSAHVVDDQGYLRRSWHPDTCPETLAVSDSSERWLGLEIGECSGGGALDANGTVTFTARFRSGTTERALRERSRFVRLNGRWVYIDGDIDF